MDALASGLTAAPHAMLVDTAISPDDRYTLWERLILRNGDLLLLGDPHVCIQQGAPHRDMALMAHHHHRHISHHHLRRHRSEKQPPHAQGART